MAMFISLKEFAAEFENEKGEKVPYHNFSVKYADKIDSTDKNRGDMISSNGYDTFTVDKIKENDIANFLGCGEVFTAEQYTAAFGQEIDLIFARTGVVGIKFKDTSFLNGDIKSPKKA